MTRFLKSYAIYVLLVVLVLVWFISYSKVPFIFFQQDELMGFGLFILNGIHILYAGFGFRDMVHFVPVTMSLSFGLFNIFGLNPIPYNIIGLIFHTINGFLVYLLGQKIFKNRLYSLVTLIIFFSNSSGSEFVMWPVINLNTISLSFSLLAVYVLVSSYIKDGYLQIKKCVCISILFLLSVFSIEYAAGLIFIIPTIAFLMDRKNRGIKKMIQIWPFYLTVIAYLILRFVPTFFLRENNTLNSVFQTGILEKAISFISLPFVYIAQIFFGQSALITISQFMSSTFWGNVANTQFAERVIYKYVAFVLGVIIVVFFLKLSSKITKLNRKYLLIFLSFIVFSSLPFVLVPGQSFSIFSSRYLYFGGVGYAFVLVLVLQFILSFKKNRIALIYIIFLILMILTGTHSNYKKGNSLYSTGNLRVQILDSIKKSYPKLPKKVIFYINSNKSYYGLPDDDKILPFQSGLGQTLLLWYYSDGNFPKKFFEGNYLWDILSEGYKEIDGWGFGYFRDYNKLKNVIANNKLNPEFVIAFDWDYYTNKLIDKTTNIRNKLKNENY